MVDDPSETVTSRAYGGDADFERIWRLCRDTYPITPVGWNWEIRRWEGQRYHDPDPAPDPRWPSWIRLWETGGGRLVGGARPGGWEGRGRPGEEEGDIFNAKTRRGPCSGVPVSSTRACAFREARSTARGRRRGAFLLFLILTDRPLPTSV